MEDRGIYVCRAENSLGLAQGWALVEIERKWIFLAVNINVMLFVS